MPTIEMLQKRRFTHVNVHQPLLQVLDCPWQEQERTVEQTISWTRCVYVSGRITYLNTNTHVYITKDFNKQSIKKEEILGIRHDIRDYW